MQINDYRDEREPVTIPINMLPVIYNLSVLQPFTCLLLINNECEIRGDKNSLFPCNVRRALHKTQPDHCPSGTSARCYITRVP